MTTGEMQINTQIAQESGHNYASVEDTPMTVEQTTILLVDDDIELCDLVKTYLEKHDFAVRMVHRGDDALDVFTDWTPDLVVLDLMLPGVSGLTVCQQLRSRFLGPILMFTALNEEIDEVVGLESGADDYLKKPVSPRLLLARIRALLRRSDSPAAPTAQHIIEAGELTVDTAKRSVTLRGESITLSTVEFDLLALLAQQAGNVVTRQDMFEALRNLDYDGLDRSIDLYVSRIRKKLHDDAKNPAIIKTVRGTGYLYAAL